MTVATEIISISCPTCGGSECIVPSGNILDNLYTLYMACNSCPPDPKLKKDAPLKIIEGEGYDNTQCNNCGARHLDIVMAEALAVMVKHGCRSKEAHLFDVGTPLIAIGCPLAFAPRLKTDDLILIADNIDQTVAEKLIDIPEIKGVIKRVGTPTQSVGILDTDSEPHTYKLLAGCDVRCDVVASSFGELCIYKSQSKIHIEFGRESPAKMQVLERLYVQGHLTGETVVDGFCGPGTLGLMCVLAGAEHVILNDAWRTAIENTLINIEANKDILEVELEKFVDTSTLPDIGDEPIHVAQAKGDGVVIDVFHGDFRKLLNVKEVDGFDICLIDTYPSVDATGFARHDMTGRMVII
ncbi:MAG: hypothetical protein P1P69_09190 [Methanosarcinaceae archaeon]|nr:hypothetical protein [Methanosarcinaceae archaeon]